MAQDVVFAVYEEVVFAAFSGFIVAEPQVHCFDGYDLVIGMCGNGEHEECHERQKRQEPGGHRVPVVERADATCCWLATESRRNRIAALDGCVVGLHE